MQNYIPFPELRKQVEGEFPNMTEYEQMMLTYQNFIAQFLSVGLSVPPEGQPGLMLLYQKLADIEKKVDAIQANQENAANK